MGYAKCDYNYYSQPDASPGKTYKGSFSSKIVNIVYVSNIKGVELPSPASIKAKEKLPEDAIFPYGGTSQLLYVKNSLGEEIEGENYIYNLPIGTYTVKYSFVEISTNVDNPYNYSLALTYTFSVVENHYPLKKWTITDVINRVVDTLEPLRYGEKPRFRLQGVIYDDETGNAIGYKKGSIAEKLDKILSPEFAFTKMNLREMLQQIGGFIHGEPRITNVNIDYEKKDIWFEFGFDKLGGDKKAYLKENYITATFGTDINEYCTSLDSSVENIVNQLSYAQGVTASPFYGREGISVRVDNTTLRVEENDNTFIPTALPINQLGGNYKLYCTYLPDYGYQNGGIDLTPYVFEKADYDNLSSYDGSFPYCKAYALYYTQGQPNIRGLFFENEAATGYQWFQNYAIVNILAQQLGIDPDELKGHLAGKYAEIKFRVEYNPIFKTRIRTNKPIISFGLPRTIAYNQSANLVESRYLGENLKGVVARLGNVEKTYTYNVAFLSDIPKIGMKVEENYIISSVATKLLPTYIQVTIALTKNFNRISNYIGVNSNKRMWEVSEKQSVDRESIITDYLVFSKGYNSLEFNDSILANNLNIKTIFNFDKYTKPISAVMVSRYTKKRNKLPGNVTLPVVSSAMGNSMSFTFGFEDNYSAGQRLTKQNFTLLNFWWSDYVAYNDYYGRFYYLYFELIGGDIEVINPTSAYTLPAGNVSGKSLMNYTASIKYRKDNREIPQISYELQAVSKDEDLIIGSALTRNCSLVNFNPESLILVLFNTEINVINSNLRDLWNTTNRVFDWDLKVNENYKVVNSPEDLENNRDVLVGIGETGFISIAPMPDRDNDITFNHKSWAIVTAPITNYITVEDEDGEITNQPIYSGCELVLGGNFRLDKETRTLLQMKLKRKVYD